MTLIISIRNIILHLVDRHPLSQICLQPFQPILEWRLLYVVSLNSKIQCLMFGKSILIAKLLIRKGHIIV